MPATKTRIATLITLFAFCALLISACGTETVKQSSEVSLAKRGLAATGAGPAKSIDCPRGVKAKVGSKFDCHLTLKSGGKLTFTMKVDKVSGSSGHMTIIGAKQG